MGINSLQMRSVVVLILCTYFWIYLRPPRCSNSTPFWGAGESIGGGQAPPGVRVILTQLVTDAGLVLCCEHCLIMILKDTATFQVLFIVSQVLFIVSIYSLF